MKKSDKNFDKIQNWYILCYAELSFIIDLVLDK